ncbi:hypothetical protein COV13_03415, partial [Candidatus Woesearchaeota archaeon CG10_big_fil_rev_8_21_14_0_10_32_9]
MKFIRQFTLIVAIFTLILCVNVSFSSAISVSDMQFSWANVPIEYISQNNPLAANIDFTFSPSTNVTGISLDAKEMNNDVRKLQEYSNIAVQIGSCNETQGGVLSCSAKNLVLRTTKNTINILFTFTLEDGTTETFSAAKTLTFDNTKPKVTKFGPDTCVDSKCYVASGSPNLIKIKMDDSLATFIRKKVAFRLGDETAYVYDCVDKTCMGYATPLCTDGVSVPLAIVQYNGLPSQDDAGNAITGLISAQVTCDSNPPIILNKTVRSSSGLSVVTSSDEAIIEVNVTDTMSPKINMTVIGDDVGAENVTVACVNFETYFTCKANVKPLTTSYGAHKFPVIITDIVGNTVSDQVNFDYYGSDDSNVSSILWKTQSTTQSSTTFIKRNMAYQRSMFVEISLSPISGTPELVKVEPNTVKCVASNPGVTGSDTDVTDLKVLYFNETSNKVYAKVTYREGGSITTGRYANLTRLDHECTLNINSKKGTTYYSKPQALNFSISVKLSDGGTLDSYLQKEIDASKKRIDDRKKLYDWYDQTLSKIITVCKLMGVIESTYGGLSGLEDGLAAFQLTAPAAIPVGVAADKLGVVKEPSQEFIEMCNYATCRGEYQKIVVDQLNKIPYVNDVAQYSGLNNFSDSFDPYKSEYVAIATGCLPAWIYHQKVKNGIECTYLNCLSDGVPNYGTSVAYCQSNKAFSQCVYSYGALLNAIPGIGLLKDAMGRIADIIKDPYTLFGTALPFACMALQKGTVTHASCNLVVTLTSIPNIIASYSGIFQPSSDPAAQCGIVLDNLGTTRQNALIGNYPTKFNPKNQEFTLSNGNTVKCASGSCTVYKGDKSTGITMLPVYNKDTQKLDNFIVYDNGKQVTLADSLTQYNGMAAQINARNEKYNLERLANNKRAAQISAYQTQINNLKSDDPDFEQKLNDLSTKLASLQQDQGSTSIFDPSRGQGFGVYAYVPLNDLEKLKNDPKTDPATKAQIEAYIADNKYLQTLGILSDNGEILASTDENENYVIPKILDIETKLAIAEAQKRKELQQTCPKCVAYLDKVQDEVRAYNDAKKEYDAEILGLESAVDYIKSMTYEDYTSHPSFVDEKTGQIVEFNSKEDFEDYKDKYVDRELDEIDKDKKILKEKEKNVVSAQNDQASAYKFNQYFGSFKDTVRTAWGVGAGLSTLRNMFNADWSSEWYDNSIFGKTSEFFGNIANIEYEICESDIAPASGSSNGVIVNAEPTSGVTTGAYITARKSALQEVPNTGDSYREYWIDGGVAPKKDGLTFKIILIGELGNEVDMTFNVTASNNPMTFAGSSSTFGGMGRSATFKSPQNFNLACIEFSTSSLREYFDYS